MAQENNEFKSAAQEFAGLEEKLRDPIVVGALMHKLALERESTNKLFEKMLEKMGALEARIAQLEQAVTVSAAKAGPRGNTLMSEVDERLIAFLRKTGRACAADVAKKFGYKGKNAASARLNALYRQGVLDKKLAGKTAYFEMSSC